MAKRKKGGKKGGGGKKRQLGAATDPSQQSATQDGYDQNMQENVQQLLNLQQLLQWQEEWRLEEEARQLRRQQQWPSPESPCAGGRMGWRRAGGAVEGGACGGGLLPASHAPGGRASATPCARLLAALP